MKLGRSLIISLIAIIGVIAAIGAAAAGDSRYIRKVESASQVIVFVHGVLGDGTSTWTNGASYCAGASHQGSHVRWKQHLCL